MRILVIGGDGFIGQPLVRQLSEQGHCVAVFHRNKRSDESRLPDGVEEIVGDRTELGKYREAIRKFESDVVIDLILSSGKHAEELIETVTWIGSAEQSHGVKSAARNRELESMSQNHKLKFVLPRVVAISSMDVYRACGVLHGSEPGPLEPLPLTEESPLRTTTETYPAERLKMLQRVFGWIDDAYDKVAVERAILAASEISATILRLPMVYGPGDHLRRFFPIVKRIEDRRPAILFAEDVAAWRSPRGYVDNVAAAIALAATSAHAEGRIYNVAESESFSELEWAQKIAEQMDWRGRFVILPREQTPKGLSTPGNFAQHWVASSEAIRRELAYAEIVTTEEAIRRTIEWERANPAPEMSMSTLDYDAEDAVLAKFG